MTESNLSIQLQKPTQARKAYKYQEDSNINMLPGDPKGSPDDSFQEKTLIFIDAGFLSKLSRYFGKGKYLTYDIIDFSKNLCKKQNLNCEKIFYYTAPPYQSYNPSQEEKRKKDNYDKFLDKLRERGVVVREGRCQRLKIDGKFIYKQKGVDILLTMDLMSIPLKYLKIKKIVLIASDSDFVSVINQLRELGLKIILYIYFTKRRNTNFSRSTYLMNVVSWYIRLTKEDFDKAP